MKIFILTIIICFSYSSQGDVKRYLSMFDGTNQRIELDITIINFNSKQKLKGSLYKINNSAFIFDNNDSRIIIEDSFVTTVNKVSKQVIKDKTHIDEISIFSLISGRFKNFNISIENLKSDEVNLIFKHNSKDITGIFFFKNSLNFPDSIIINSGNTNKIVLDILNVNKIKKIPHLEFKNYEFINLYE